MINHLEPIDMAMEKAIEDGMLLNEVTRSHRVSAALRVHKAYLEQKGGEKTI
jgi:hypothetical protein